METRPSAIELRDVAVETVASGEARILRCLSWTIGQDDFWVTGGMAGSGKTVLLETAAGLRPPAEGTVTLFGAPADILTESQARATRRRIGFVYGGGGRLLGHLTLAQNIALPLCYHRNCDAESVAEEVAAWLSRFGLLAMAGRLPGQVNLAYRQRTALARALALKPEVLFLDDPLAELNTSQVRWWVRLLESTRAGENPPDWPHTWVVATDDLRPWLAVGRQFAIIQDGGLRVLGGREDLHGSHEPLVRELLAESLLAG